LLAQLRPDSPVYHVCWRIDLEGTLDVDALRSALAELPARHEALRTIFVPIDDEPRQLVQGPDAAALPVTVRDLTTEAAASGAEADGLAGQLAAAERRRPFDLARGPLARATVARTGDRS